MTAGKTAIAVAIVEDDDAVRASLAQIIAGESGLHCVATCASAEEAIALLPSHRPRVVLMDVHLPGMDGVGCVTALVARLPDVQVVMLTVHDDTEVIFAALAAGACGYLLKPIRAAELVKAVRDVVGGGAPMTSNIARRVVQAFKKPLPRPDPNPALAELTAREREILEMLAQGYQYKEIAERTGTSYHTVHAHIRRIYEKLHVRSRAMAVSLLMDRTQKASGIFPADQH